MWVMRKRILPAAAISVAAALLIPVASASADLVDLGKLDSALKPGCPGEQCFAISRTTAFRARSGAATSPMVAPRSGRVVAWTVALGKPTSKQIKYFDGIGGGQAQAQLAVLQRSTNKKKRTTYSVVALSEMVKLEPYFGRTSTFALRRTIPIKKGQVVGITVPTWAPAMVTGQNTDFSWRASRTKAQCEATQDPTAQTEVKSTAQYDCLYRGVVLTYSALMVPTPVSSR